MKFQLRVKSQICSLPRYIPIAVEITRSKLGHLVTALFLIKKTFSNILSVQNTLYFFRNPSTTQAPATPTIPSPKSGGRNPQPSRIDAHGTKSFKLQFSPSA